MITRPRPQYRPGARVPDPETAQEIYEASKAANYAALVRCLRELEERCSPSPPPA